MSIEEIIKMAHNYGCLYESTLSEVYSEETLLKDLKKQLTLTDVGKCNELLCDFIMKYDPEISLEDAEIEVSTFMQMQA